MSNLATLLCLLCIQYLIFFLFKGCEGTTLSRTPPNINSLRICATTERKWDSCLLTLNMNTDYACCNTKRHSIKASE